ncbi:MAG: recombinase, partial [Johnsonella sp.]|nr:recombinase [Johnsonella sp.]
NMQEKSVLTPGSFKFRPKEEWGRVANNHEALVSMEDFLKVREILNKNRFMQGKNTDYEWYKKSPLQGFARCPVCNHILSCTKSEKVTQTKGTRTHRYFSCRICRCNGIKVRRSRAKDLEEQVFAAIKEKYGNETQKTIEKKDSSKELERKVESLENKKMKSFDKYKLGNISREKFIETKAKLDEEIESLKAQIRRIKEEEANRKEIREDGLTREMMQKYIQSVICGVNEVLEIQWK